MCWNVSQKEKANYNALTEIGLFFFLYGARDRVGVEMRCIPLSMISTP